MQRAGDKKAIVWQIFRTCKVKKVKLQGYDYKCAEL
jgi:hypothetical protein